MGSVIAACLTLAIIIGAVVAVQMMTKPNETNSPNLIDTDAIEKQTSSADNDLSSLFSSCAALNYFYSVKDLETYLYIGFTKAEDYIQSPDFEHFTSLTSCNNE